MRWMFMRFYEPEIAAKLWVLKQCQVEKNLTRLIHIQRAKKICVFFAAVFSFRQQHSSGWENDRSMKMERAQR